MFAWSKSQALASREELVRTGKMTTIIFIRDLNNKGQEVSGYIDYAHRLRTEDFVPYFDRKYVDLAFLVVILVEL